MDRCEFCRCSMWRITRSWNHTKAVIMQLIQKCRFSNCMITTSFIFISPSPKESVSASINPKTEKSVILVRLTGGKKGFIHLFPSSWRSDKYECCQQSLDASQWFWGRGRYIQICCLRGQCDNRILNRTADLNEGHLCETVSVLFKLFIQTGCLKSSLW